MYLKSAHFNIGAAFRRRNRFRFKSFSRQEDEMVAQGKSHKDSGISMPDRVVTAQASLSAKLYSEDSLGPIAQKIVWLVNPAVRFFQI